MHAIHHRSQDDRDKSPLIQPQQILIFIGNFPIVIRFHSPRIRRYVQTNAKKIHESTEQWQEV